MSETFTYDVFISQSAKDTPVVRELTERLKRGWLSRVWFDEWEIQPGDIISLKIEPGLEDLPKPTSFPYNHSSLKFGLGELR
jgi:hypothetical protein